MISELQSLSSFEWFPLRMASTFQLGNEQPSLKPNNLTKAAANSFNNLFGPPAPVKVDDGGDGYDDGDDNNSDGDYGDGDGDDRGDDGDYDRDGYGYVDDLW